MKRLLTSIPTVKVGRPGILTVVYMLTLVLLVLAGGCTRQTVESVRNEPVGIPPIPRSPARCRRC